MYYFRVVRNPVLEVMLLDNNEPTSYGEAMVGPDSDKWLEAMKSEIGSMYENKVLTTDFGKIQSERVFSMRKFHIVEWDNFDV